jgi:DNA-binding beta-propeller fold protein YncE
MATTFGNRAKQRSGRHRALLLAVSALCFAACATPARQRGPAVFFPGPPALPRVQHLVSFNGLRDIEEQSGFERFVIGEKQNLQLDKPYGVAIHDGKIYVCDTNTTVVVLDLAKKRYGSMPGAIGAGKLLQPVNITIERDGTKYVSDPLRGQVVVFDAKDQFVRAIGEPGDWKPVDAAPFEDRLYVVDNEHAVVRVFDKRTGAPIRTIGDAKEANQRLVRPANLAFSPDGDLYVSDMGRFQVVKFDRDGHFKSAVGKLGDSVGHFARPKGIAVDPSGNLLAVDAAFNNVQVFNRDGRLLMFFGDGGDQAGGLLLPAQVTIDRDNIKYFADDLDPAFEAEYLILVTSQFGPKKVNVYAFGKERGKRYPTDEELQRLIEGRQKRESAKPPGNR